MPCRNRYVQLMYWLRRPPYLRWIVAGLVVCCGIYLDIRPEPVVVYPFTAARLASGELVTEIAWRPVPTGLLPEWVGEVAGVAATGIPADTPLLPALVVTPSMPDGWWSISLPVSQRVAPGTPIRIAWNGQIADGLVVGETTDSGFELRAPVAFPPAQAELVATIDPNTTPVMMVGSSTP